MLRFFALIALAVCPRLALAAGGVLPDFAPPATKFVVGIEWHTILTSPVAQDLLAEAKTSSASWMSQSPFSGFDPFRDLDEIVIAGTGTQKDAPVLVVLRGRFQASRMPGATTYHGVPVFQPKGADSATAILDDATAIAGTLAEVRAAIDRRGRGNLAPPMPDLEAMRGKYAVWALGSGLGASNGPSGAPEGLQSLDRFQFGLVLEEELQITGSLHVRDAADAAKLAQWAALAELMAKSQPAANGAKFESHLAANTLSVSVKIPKEVLKKTIEQQKAAFTKALSHQVDGNPASPYPTFPAPAPAPRSRETKIVTDDNGSDVLVKLPGSR